MPGVEMETIKISPLNQLFEVGSLYDLRSMQSKPNINLWDEKVLANYMSTTLTPDEHFTYDIVELESLKDKMEHFGITGIQKLAVYAGLLKVGGIQGSILDAQTPPDSVRVYVKCQIRKMTCQLDTEHLSPDGVDYPEIHDELDASHLVTAVEKTIEGYFCFTKAIAEGENPKKARKVLMGQIHDEIAQHQDAAEPSSRRSNGLIHVGHCDTQENQSSRSEVENSIDSISTQKGEPDGGDRWSDPDVQFEFHGDFKLTQAPCSFDDALKLIAQLSTNPSMAVHAKLTPKAAVVVPLYMMGQKQKGNEVPAIAEAMINQIEEYLQAYSQQLSRFTELQQHVSAQKVEFLADDVSGWIKALGKLEDAFRAMVRRAYNEAIESGNWNSLARRLESLDASVFSINSISRAAADMSRTSELIGQMLDCAATDGVQFVGGDAEVKKLSAGMRSESVICFALHSCCLESKGLKMLESKLRSRKTDKSARSKEWHDNDDQLNTFCKKFERFLRYFAENKNAGRKFVMSETEGQKSGETLFSITVNNRGTSREFELPTAPSAPSAIDAETSQNSVTLIWKEPDIGKEHVQRYFVEYAEDSAAAAGDFNQYHLPNEFPSAVINGLLPGKSYVFSVRAVTYGDLVSEESPLSETIATSLSTRLSSRILKNSNPSPGKKDKVKIFTPKNKKQLVKGDVEKYSIGKPRSDRPGSRTILIVGATGTGKTTFLNSMANFLFGVRLEDNFRFKIVTEADEGNQTAQSVTKKVSAYVLHDTVLDYSLTVIDTPGYGDTEGLEADKHTTKLIKQLFEAQGPAGVDRLDAVCLVVKASDTRLTAQQRHNFNSVLALFGNDIAENIVIIATFSDASDPPVVLALDGAQVPYTKLHKFNNSGFFEGKKNDRHSQDALQFYWKLGQKGFEEFFDGLDSAKPKSLSLSRLVLERREQLEFLVMELHHSVRNGISKLETMSQEFFVLEKFEAKIKANGHFKYTVKEDKVVTKELDVGIHTTACLHCNRTCHRHCQIPDDGAKWACWAMDDQTNQDSSCRICPENCHWSKHKNVPYEFVVESQTVVKTDEDLRSQYTKAKKDRQSKEAMLNSLAHQFGKTQMNILGFIRGVRSSLQELAQIAMRPNYMTDVDYIETLIQSEKDEALPGFRERIRHLENQKEIAQQVANAKDPNFDPFKEYREEAEGKGWLKFLHKFLPGSVGAQLSALPANQEQASTPTAAQAGTSAAAQACRQVAVPQDPNFNPFKECKKQGWFSSIKKKFT